MDEKERKICYGIVAYVKNNNTDKKYVRFDKLYDKYMKIRKEYNILTKEFKELEDVIREAEAKAEAKAKGKAEVKAEGKAEVKAEGKALNLIEVNIVKKINVILNLIKSKFPGDYIFSYELPENILEELMVYLSYLLLRDFNFLKTCTDIYFILNDFKITTTALKSKLDFKCEDIKSKAIILRNCVVIIGGKQTKLGKIEAEVVRVKAEAEAIRAEAARVKAEAEAEAIRAEAANTIADIAKAKAEAEAANTVLKQNEAKLASFNFIGKLKKKISGLTENQLNSFIENVSGKFPDLKTEIDKLELDNKEDLDDKLDNLSDLINNQNQLTQENMYRTLLEITGDKAL